MNYFRLPILLILTCLQGVGFAQTSSLSAQACDPNLLTKFFPSVLVEETLDAYNVPLYNRQWIVKDLANREAEVIRTFENKARMQRPKPLVVNEQTLSSPEIRRAVMNLFQESLLEVFTQTLRRYGINNKDQVQAMFDHLENQKAQYFDECVSKGGAAVPPGYPLPENQQVLKPK